MINFIIPCFNAAPNILKLFKSLQEQTDDRWKALFIDDASTDGGKTTREIELLLSKFRGKVDFQSNLKNKGALQNIVEAVINRQIKDVVAIIDGDDQLCNSDTVKILHNAYDEGAKVAWTAHKWDTNGMNISKDMPQFVNAYQYPWCSSHLKTFSADLLYKISKKNFIDENGSWFKRGYDQALMLPLLQLAKGKRKYLNSICYLYNINSVSVNDRDWAERLQLKTVNLVRARGLLYDYE